MARNAEEEGERLFPRLPERSTLKTDTRTFGSLAEVHVGVEAVYVVPLAARDGGLHAVLVQTVVCVRRLALVPVVVLQLRVVRPREPVCQWGCEKDLLRETGGGK